MKFAPLVLMAATLLPQAALAAEYYVYKDSGGTIVLSNLPAQDRPGGRSPESLSLVASRTWIDATRDEVAATEKANRELAQENALRDIAVQTQRIADEIQKLNDIALTELNLRPSTEINQVIVAQNPFGHVRSRLR